MVDVQGAHGIPLLTLKTDRADARAVVHLVGELDISSAPLLQEELGKLLEERPEQIVLNLDDLSYLDSTGLSLFVSTTKRAHSSGIKVVLRNPRESTQRLLEITSLVDYFDLDDEAPK